MKTRRIAAARRIWRLATGTVAASPGACGTVERTPAVVPTRSHPVGIVEVPLLEPRPV